MGFFEWLFNIPSAPERKVEDYNDIIKRMIEEKQKALLDVKRDLHFQMDGSVDFVNEESCDEQKIDVAYFTVTNAINKELEKQRCEREEYERRQREQGGSHARLSLRAGSPVPFELSMIDRQHTFGKMLVDYVNKRCEGKASICYQRAGVSRQLYSKIISDMTKMLQSVQHFSCV